MKPVNRADEASHITCIVARLSDSIHIYTFVYELVLYVGGAR